MPRPLSQALTAPRSAQKAPLFSLFVFTPEKISFELNSLKAAAT
jgi:hypothetical protein